jgi:hypothetical protein
MHASMSLIKHWETFQRATGTAVHSSAVPRSTELFQNFPNPFNPITTISFKIPVSGFTTLKVYDMLGREVKTLVNLELQPGSYNLTFDGRDIASGVYLYNLATRNSTQSKLMVIMK